MHNDFSLETGIHRHSGAHPRRNSWENICTNMQRFVLISLFCAVIVLICVMVSLFFFCEVIGVFCVLISLFCAVIVLFCVMVSLFLPRLLQIETIKASSHISMSRVTHMNTSCHTHEYVMPIT